MVDLSWVNLALVVSGTPADESLCCCRQIDPDWRLKVARRAFSTNRLPSRVAMGEPSKCKPQTGQLPDGLQVVSLA
jgi:hypothetical protein